MGIQNVAQHKAALVKALDWFIKCKVIGIGNNRWYETENYCWRDHALLE